MQTKKISDNWLFQQHSRQTIMGWVKQLRYFYFTRAWGVSENKGDAFKLELTYKDKQDLQYKFEQLGIPLRSNVVNFPALAENEITHPDCSSKKVTPIKRFRFFEQPGNTIVFGHRAYIWISDMVISISISGTKDGNCHEVSNEDVEVCLDIENHINRLHWEDMVIRDAQNSIYCISREKYPELFGLSGFSPQ